MRVRNSGFVVILLLLLQFSAASALNYVKARPKRGDGIYALLRRYRLPTNTLYVEKFRQLNANLLGARGKIKLGFYYKLPIYRYVYNGRNIRSTLGISDYSVAKKIQNYNRELYRIGLKRRPYTVDKDLWVPFGYLTSVRSSKQSAVYPIFGSRYRNLKRVDNVLKNRVYYLVSGHGGPDPGAIGKRGRFKLYEDEYAYDITLRLARRLLEHGATVYMIVQDPNDGIRDSQILRGDRDEYYYGGVKISSNRSRRLKKRAEIINSLYRYNRSRARSQDVIIIHVDSRSTSKRIDIFYYYKSNHRSSRKLAWTLYRTIKRKYAEKQPGRGYRGTVSTRNLHMLRECVPTTVYLELGNIKNSLDQDRLILENNRQAIANWLCEGLINAANN